MSEIKPEIDEDVQLPADTLAILQEFLQEQKSKNLEENWQLSQFWYDKETKKVLSSVAKLIVESKGKSASIALLSCPSLYEDVKKKHANVKLFEFDTRFSRIGDDFVHYDYNLAEQEGYLDHFRGLFDLIIIDPPFLSEECSLKTAKIAKKLSRDTTKLILCSGLVVKDWAEKYFGVKLCEFKPQHERNLGNEFVSYANFDLDSFISKAQHVKELET